MPATKKKKSPARSPIHRIKMPAGKKSGASKLTSEQRKKIGKVAAADFDKVHEKKQDAIVKSLSRKLEKADVSNADRIKLCTENRMALREQDVAGAAASHKTTRARVTTAAKARRADRAERYERIRKEYQRHSKKPKMSALQKTAAMMSCSINTVRRAID
jgi:hypothetical protein